MFVVFQTVCQKRAAKRHS